MSWGALRRTAHTLLCAVLLLGAAPVGAQASILGEDNREADHGQQPWTDAVGYVMRADAKNGVLSGIGTAFLVGPRVILTNWHNVFGDDGALQDGDWVFVADGNSAGRKIKILHHFQFTPVTKTDVPLKPRNRSRDVIALVLEEAVEYAPLTLAPPAAADRAISAVGPARYTMAGVSLTFDYDGATPRTVQSGCSFASLARNAQFPRAPGLIGHTCDVWPGHSGAPLVETATGKSVVRAINVAQVYPEISRETYERRKHAGENIPLNLVNHINIAIPVTPAIVDMVARANAFAAKLPATELVAAAAPR
ncbi:MAG: serine protease [Rhodospirillaceae bacterium]